MAGSHGVTSHGHHSAGSSCQLFTWNNVGDSRGHETVGLAITVTCREQREVFPVYSLIVVYRIQCGFFLPILLFQTVPITIYTPGRRAPRAPGVPRRPRARSWSRRRCRGWRRRGEGGSAPTRCCPARWGPGTTTQSTATRCPGATPASGNMFLKFCRYFCIRLSNKYIFDE